MGLYSKKFDELKTFSDWLTWKQEDRLVSRLVVLVMAITIIAAGMYIIGFSQGYYAHPTCEAYEAACSAVGMGHARSSSFAHVCIDGEGNFHEIVIKEGKVHIEGLGNGQG